MQRIWSVARPRSRQRGFTLFETILVIVTLGVVAGAIVRLQSNAFAAQTLSRDEVAGVELLRACAERILAVRRASGYAAPAPSNAVAPAIPTCNGLGGTGDYAADPTVTMTNGAVPPATVTVCEGSICNITITVAKSKAPFTTLAPLVLQLSNY